MTRIGILGGGQLGRMLVLAGAPLGLEFLILDPTPNGPAGQVAEQLVAPYDDEAALREIASRCDVATFEFENVPAAAVTQLSEAIPVHPRAEALFAGQDRLSEKTLFRSLGMETAPFLAVDDEAGLRAAISEIGLPAVLKTRREGYDGKGQAVVRVESEAEEAFARLGGKPLILEGFVPFERELSILAVRSARGETAFYPLVDNRHREGILRLSRVPAIGIDAAIQTKAEEEARRLIEELDYVGVLAIEYFFLDGRLLANEMAPRVHNSGHWTTDGAVTSQFENHVRAVMGFPLGATSAVGTSAMVNLIGEVPDLDAMLEVPFAHVHLYGKDARPERKLGHVTVNAPDAGVVASSLKQLNDLVREPALDD
ncbi:MAG: 5-(carboxyamino)imidazole ribonucleotide synthase [Dehalococcoidia bacterium]